MVPRYMSRISAIQIGIVLLIIGFVGETIFPFSRGGWTQYLSLSSSIGIVFIAAGLLARLFSRSAHSGGIASAGASHKEAEFTFWRNALSAGFFFWFAALLGTFMSFDSGPSFFAYALLGTHLAALPIAIVCLVLASYKRSTDLDRAIFIMKLRPSTMLR